MRKFTCGRLISNICIWHSAISESLSCICSGKDCVAVGLSFMAELILLQFFFVSFRTHASALPDVLERTQTFLRKKFQKAWGLLLDWAESRFFRGKSAKAMGSLHQIGLNSGFLGKKCQSHGKFTSNWVEFRLYKEKSSKKWATDGTGMKSNVFSLCRMKKDAFLRPFLLTLFLYLILKIGLIFL